MLRKRLATALALTMMTCALAVSFTASSPARAETTDVTPELETHDVLVLRSGKIIEGTILEETDSEIRIEVAFRGGIKAPTTYQKSEVLEVKRNVARKTASIKSKTRDVVKTPARGDDEVDMTGAAVYLAEFEGDFGRDITATPLQDVIDDALEHDPDVIIIKLDCGTRVQGFDGLFTAEDLGPIIEETLGEGHRVVFWIKRAQAGAAFLPFVSPEMYFTEEGVLGGVGDLGDFDIGDDWVNEKQISLRLGHAEGFAIKGGYDPVLIRALARMENWLFVKWEGGAPIYIEREPRPSDGDGWTLLTDDGAGDNEDEWTFEGNDVLNIDADMAERLRISKGTYDKLDDLVYNLNIGRDYHIVDGRSERILEMWREGVDRAEDDFKRIQVEIAELGNQGSRQALGKRRTKLKQLRSLLTRYAEVFDPEGQIRAQIDVQLEDIRLAFQSANNGRTSGRGNSPGRLR